MLYRSTSSIFSQLFNSFMQPDAYQNSTHDMTHWETLNNSQTSIGTYKAMIGVFCSKLFLKTLVFCILDGLLGRDKEEHNVQTQSFTYLFDKRSPLRNK